MIRLSPRLFFFLWRHAMLRVFFFFLRVAIAAVDAALSAAAAYMLLPPDMFTRLCRSRHAMSAMMAAPSQKGVGQARTGQLW